MPGSVSPTHRSITGRRRGVVRLVAAALALGSLALGASGAGGAEAWTAWYAATAGDPAEVVEADGHLVVSEVMTGGASASDEFIEIYNPTASMLPLEGLEIIYVTASGATISRKGEWAPGATGVAPGGHVLVANEAGAFAALADLTYANGLAASGGSVALRIRDATTAIDAVGWGTAASAWLEGAPAPAVSAGHSLERLPGGASGSGQDTDQNAADFADRAIPDPQNAAAPPITVSPSPQPSQTATPTQPATPVQSATPTPTPALTPTPAPTASATPMPTPTPIATASPTPVALTIAAARLLPDGSIATIEGVSLTDSTFTDGGGYVSDATAGIAVTVSGGTFARGQLVRVTGEVDDRFHQRTLRADATGVAIVGPTAEREATNTDTGSIDEGLEGQLVAVSATVASAATALSGGVAFDIDDGSGPARLVVLDASGIDHSGWVRGTVVQLRGVVGQRDSSGTGTAGYRLQPRDVEDVISATGPSPTPSPSPSGGTASPSPSAEPGLMSIASARQAAVNSRVRVRGVVTLPSSVLSDGTAAIQDGTGAIILRLGDEAGDVSQGEIVVVDGKRSTKSGMETVLVSVAPERRGNQAQPAASRHATGDLGEEQEALLVTVRGAVVTTPRRTSAQNVYFDLDDGSGPLRVYISPRTGIGVTAIELGATLELTGVLGQETSGSQPERGYRLWPRRSGDVRVLAGADPTAATGSSNAPVPGIAVPGGSGPLGGPAAAAPTRPPDLVVPQLRAPRLPRTDPTHAPEADFGGVQPTSAASPGSIAPWLAVAAAVLAGVGAVAAAQPGMLERLRLALVRPATLVGAEPGSAPEPRAAGAEPTSPLERTVARLMPLAVVEDAAPGEPVPSTTSRSRVRRILPPT